MDAIGHPSVKGQGWRQVQLKLEITYVANRRREQLQQDLVTSVDNRARLQRAWALGGCAGTHHAWGQV